ncbi:hypothetical protein NPIL_71001 [Nephila pilipes]|uniref:Uncharacterized protein n=1 Tax=Nephila pilipes TaxID=299642 RepID=A0A8X6T4D4_NEPPI|nr:hypothetical protein NPIL_71001 [Nephila pilipes]
MVAANNRSLNDAICIRLNYPRVLDQDKLRYPVTFASNQVPSQNPPHLETHHTLLSARPERFSVEQKTVTASKFPDNPELRARKEDFPRDLHYSRSLKTRAGNPLIKRFFFYSRTYCECRQKLPEITLLFMALSRRSPLMNEMKFCEREVSDEQWETIECVSRKLLILVSTSLKQEQTLAQVALDKAGESLENHVGGTCYTSAAWKMYRPFSFSLLAKFEFKTTVLPNLL